MSNFDELDLVILKTITTNKKYGVDFANEFDLTKQQLFSSEVWNFANIVTNYIKTYKELPTLRVLKEKISKTNNKQLLENINKIWLSLDSITYDDKEYKHDLEKLKKRFAEKQIANIQQSLNKIDEGNLDINKTLTEMQRTIQSVKSLNQTKAYERKTLKESLSSFREEYNAKLNDPNFDRGIKTGYSYFDSVTDGLRPGELVLIGAESGGGKSMLLMNMAIQLWLQNNTQDMESFGPGNSVLYFSLEMPFKPCLNRVLSRLSNNQSKLIRNAKLDSEDAAKLLKTLKFIKKYPYEFEIVDIPRGATMESLELIYEDAKANFDPKIIVIDYLGLMDYDGPDMDDWLKLGKISEKIHEFARVHNCTVLSAVQLNRAKSGKDTEEKIGLHRVGRSALILQNANIVVQIETRANEKQYPDMLYHMIKNRDGQLGSGSLIKNLACGTLVDNCLEDNDTKFEMCETSDISEKINILDF